MYWEEKDSFDNYKLTILKLTCNSVLQSNKN